MLLSIHRHFWRITCAFAKPEDDLQKYDYRLERILARLSGAETVLDDPRLDWDICRAYLLYENSLAGSNEGNDYKTSQGGQPHVQGLDSPKDLLWWHLSRNAKSIKEDKERRRWWVDTLTQGMRAAGGRPWRRWFLLQLVESTDSKTEALIVGDANDEGDAFPILKPDPFSPFIVLEGSDFVADDAPKQPPFAEAIKLIASEQKLSYVLWDIDPASMPPTKAVETDLAPRLSQVAPALILCQESWSETPHYFAVNFSRPKGRRSANCNVRLPPQNSTDGVFFFTYDVQLYVWPKVKMDDAVVQMLHVSGLINDERYAVFLGQGYARLDVRPDDR